MLSSEELRPELEPAPSCALTGCGPNRLSSEVTQSSRKNKHLPTQTGVMSHK